MRLPSALLLALVFIGRLGLQADDPADSRIPRFPRPYSDYQVVPGSISQNERFAVILRDITNGDEPSKNCIVALSPFRVLKELPTDAVFIEGSRSGGLNVNWNRNNSAAVIAQEGKFGPNKIFVVIIANDNVVKITDLLSILKEFVRPDFNKSGADPFNDNIDFFIDEDGVWTFNESDQITIDCEFTNDPRLSARVNWTGRLTAKWDTKRGKLIDAHFSRTH